MANSKFVREEMKYWFWIIVFAALTMFFIQLQIRPLYFFSGLIALVLVLGLLWHKGQEHGKKAGKRLEKGFREEWEKVEKAKGTYPSSKVWAKYATAVGKKTAEGLHAKEEEKWSSPNFFTRLENAIKSALKEFGEFFKK